MNSQYSRMMRSASYLLFVLSGVVLAFSLVSTFVTAVQMGSPPEGTLFAQRGLSLLTILAGIAGSLQAAGFLFFGAALLYRLDKWLEAAE